MIEIQKKLRAKKAEMIGKTYRHFKGNLYEVIDLAVSSDGVPMVIYRSVDSMVDVWARPLEEFESLVDRDKYPDVEQKERFKLVNQVVAFMDIPEDCSRCPFGRCSYSHPFWSDNDPNTKGYVCQLKPPNKRTVEDFDYDEPPHISNCPLVPSEAIIVRGGKQV